MSPLDHTKDGEVKGIPREWTLIAFKPRWRSEHLWYVLCERKTLFYGSNWVTWIYSAHPDIVGQCESTCTSGHYHRDPDKAMADFNALGAEQAWQS